MKQIWKSTVCISLLALLAVSCSQEEGLLGGKEEHWTITNKNSGTQNVYEKYAQEARLYKVDNNPKNIYSVEFTSTGQYIITYQNDYGDYYTSPARLAKKVTVETAEGRLRIPLSLCKEAKTRNGGDAYYKTEKGTYTYDNGVYHLVDIDWIVENGTLTVRRDGVVDAYMVHPAESVGSDELTRRLCHRWTLKEVLLKIYKDNRLVFSYQLKGEEMEEYCVSEIEFTRYGTFLRYDNEGYGNYNAGAGIWNWIDRSEQTLHYCFLLPLIGNNDLTAYFASNHFYMTEEIEELVEDFNADYDDYERGKFKAVCLYRMAVVGNER